MTSDDGYFRSERQAAILTVLITAKISRGTVSAAVARRGRLYARLRCPRRFELFSFSNVNDSSSGYGGSEPKIRTTDACAIALEPKNV